MRADGRLRIGELAKRAGVSPQAVRFYEAEGLLPAPARTAAGYRTYDLSALGRLEFIRRARHLGLSLEEIREVIQLAGSRKAPCCRVRELLGAKLNDLNRKIEELTRFRDQLRRFMKELATLPDQADTSQQVCALIEIAPSFLSRPAAFDERASAGRKRPAASSRRVGKTKRQAMAHARALPAGRGEYGSG